ncbi:hypothetical protein T310_5304, partial [Rasamsonia emersonii CBS 393.64]
YSGPKCSGKFPASASSLSPGPELRRTTRTSLGREEALSGVTTAAPSPFSPQVTSDPASLGPSLALPKVKKTDDRPVPRSLGELGLVARHLHLVLDIINSTVPPVLRPRPCPVLVLVAGRGADCWLLDDMRAVPCHPPVSVSENRRLAGRSHGGVSEGRSARTEPEGLPRVCYGYATGQGFSMLQIDLGNPPDEVNYDVDIESGVLKKEYEIRSEQCRLCRVWIRSTAQHIQARLSSNRSTAVRSTFKTEPALHCQNINIRIETALLKQVICRISDEN